MFCPRCGNQAETAASQCSACGLALGPVRELLAEGPARQTRIDYRRALGTGGLNAAGVVLAILWIIFFAVGEVSAEAFLPFLSVLTWIAAVILAIHLGTAWHRRRRRTAPAPSIP